MTLVLEIEYLSGVSFAAIGPDSEAPDWPPQPDRVFSALIATWAARGENSDEARALEWLESQSTPRVIAPAVHSRTARLVYVPPNDYKLPEKELTRLKWYREYLANGIRPPKDSKLGDPRKGWLKAVGVHPDWRVGKERYFPAARLPDCSSCLRLVWNDAMPDECAMAALRLLARDTAYVGHSASLTRCRFTLTDDARATVSAELPARSIYPGRFAELRRCFAMRTRPLPGSHVAETQAAPLDRASAFSDRWLVLEHVGGDMPDIRTCALVAKTLRRALLAAYERIGLSDRIPEVVSGHTADRSPSRHPHLAIVPMPFAGFAYADGHPLGFALVPPRGSSILEDDDFRRALRALAPIDDARDRRVLTLKAATGTRPDQAFSIALSPTLDPPTDRRSLDPARYSRTAQYFATVTPIALDRHLKETGAAREDETVALIAAACRNAGLPEPEKVVVDKHSAVEGMPSAYPSARSPAWLHWRLPPSLASRQLTHAVLRFAHSVQGPVVLGAGRFIGLGLCLPLDAEANGC